MFQYDPTFSLYDIQMSTLEVPFYLENKSKAYPYGPQLVNL